MIAMTQHEAVERLRALFPGCSVNVTLVEWWQAYSDGDKRSRFRWTAYVAAPFDELWEGETLAEVMAAVERFAAERAEDLGYTVSETVPAVPGDEAERLAAEADKRTEVGS